MREVTHRSLTNEQYILVMALQRGPAVQLSKVETAGEAARCFDRIKALAIRDGCYEPEAAVEVKVGDYVVDEWYEWDEMEWAGSTRTEAIEEQAGGWGFKPYDEDTWEAARLMLDGKGRVRRYEDGEVGEVVTRAMR